MNEIDLLSIEMLGCGVSYEETLLQRISSMADINQKGEDGRTLLIHCCAYNFPKAFYELIKRGADVNQQGKKGFSALHVAALRGNNEFSEALLEHGAYVDLVDCFGNNPLFRVPYDNLSLINLLIRNGCDPYHKNNFGVAPYDKLSLHPETIALFNAAQSE